MIDLPPRLHTLSHRCSVVSAARWDSLRPSLARSTGILGSDRATEMRLFSLRSSGRLSFRISISIRGKSGHGNLSTVLPVLTPSVYCGIEQTTALYPDCVCSTINSHIASRSCGTAVLIHSQSRVRSSWRCHRSSVSSFQKNTYAGCPFQKNEWAKLLSTVCVEAQDSVCVRSPLFSVTCFCTASSGEHSPQN